VKPAAKRAVKPASVKPAAKRAVKPASVKPVSAPASPAAMASSTPAIRSLVPAQKRVTRSVPATV
jgi:hypothetical protein